MAGSPGIVPKAALTGSRIIYYPFTIPTKLNDSATLFGKGAHSAVMGINSAVGGFYQSLQPRRGAQHLMKLFVKVQEAVPKSAAMAERNKAVFWDPFSQGTEAVGRALASPGAYYYLKKAGMDQPTPDAIKGVLNMGLFDYPVAGPPPPAQGGGGEPAAQGPPPAAAPSQDAAEGAGQTQAPAA